MSPSKSGGKLLLGWMEHLLSSHRKRREEKLFLEIYLYLVYMVSSEGLEGERGTKMHEKISQGILLCDMINLITKKKIKGKLA